MTQLQVTNLGKEFHSSAETLHVLKDVNLKMVAGENLSIVGPSGCGKSTLLYMLGTLDKPTQGKIKLDEVDPFVLSTYQLARFRNTNVGFVFQDHHLLPQLTVTDNVLLSTLAFGGPTAELLERANTLIADVGLEERKTHFPGQLSGGERQRVAVARALLHRPKLLLADEPTGNLDEENAHKITELLFDLPKREGAMLIVVTHSDWVASQAAKRMRIENKTLVSQQAA